MLLAGIKPMAAIVIAGIKPIAHWTEGVARAPSCIKQQ